MKKKILVLDAFTNGHEAALAFIKRKGWTEADCEIVFCGTHPNVFKRLTEEPTYAVVPIRNSIAGEVTEVTKHLAKFRKTGYDLQQRDRLDLQINHCLLAPQYVERAEDLERVMSHEKAIQQCGRFLDSIGITPDRRSKRDSTGNAAKAVAKLGPNVKIGAIAPRAAAEEYGLKVLSEGIQDVPDNKTTFVLLQNEATVKRVVVGIIGINGYFGQMLKGFFEQLGCPVIGSDEKKPTGLSNAQVVKRSEVVIFSVPIKDTPVVIRSVLPEVRESQLLMDVTSVKQPAVEAMLESRAQVVGLHPMFRPEVPFDGQTVVACPARLTDRNWKTWVVNILTATRAQIKWSTPAEHDGYMTTVQVTPHLGNLTSALLITEAGVSVSESLAFTSPFYRVMFSLMGRLVSQSPDLYTSIVMENPETLMMLERRIAIEQRLVEMIREKDQVAFEKLFAKINTHFGQDVTTEANELFMRILGVLSTLYGKNSVTLEFCKTQSRPGLLERISRVFSQRQINLTGINSVALDSKRLQFTLSFEQSRASDEVRRALEEIEDWSDPKVKVLD
ncbi:MAG: prephenate dehydrogenase/arogenate dehydrogenase family protein [Candidatus Paceibacterota bacterium]